MLDPQDRHGIGVDQQPDTGHRYPLVDPSPDVDRLLGDVWLSYQDDEQLLTLPLHIAWLYGFGTQPADPPPGFPTPVHAKDAIIADALNQVVFDSTEALSYAEVEWGDRLLVVEWKTAHQVLRVTTFLLREPDPGHSLAGSSGGVQERRSVWQFRPDRGHLPAATGSSSLQARRMLVGLYAGGGPDAYALYITPVSGVLDSRTYSALPLRLRSLRLNEQSYNGKISLEPGYNMALTAQPQPRHDGRRLVTRLQVSGTPGAGLGRSPGCIDEVPLVRRINQAVPDGAGNFFVQLDDCLRQQLPAHASGHTAIFLWPGLDGQQASSGLVLFDDCKPCCECDDFANTYRGLSRVWDKWQAAAMQAEQVRDDYADDRERWLLQQACRLEHPLRVVLQREPACTTVVGAVYCNMTRCCLAPVQLRFTFQLYNNGVLVPGTPAGLTIFDAFLAASDRDESRVTPQVSWPVVRFTADSLGPQQSLTAKFRVFFACTATQTLKITVTLHTPDREACPLAEPGVPQDILDLWASVSVPADQPSVARVIETKSVPLVP